MKSTIFGFAVVCCFLPIAYGLKCIQCPGEVCQKDTPLPEAKECEAGRDRCTKAELYAGDDNVIGTVRNCAPASMIKPEILGCIQMPPQDPNSWIKTNITKTCTYICDSDGCNSAPALPMVKVSALFGIVGVILCWIKLF